MKSNHIQSKIDQCRNILNELDELNDFKLKEYEQQYLLITELQDNAAEMLRLLEARKEIDKLTIRKIIY